MHQVAGAMVGRFDAPSRIHRRTLAHTGRYLQILWRYETIFWPGDHQPTSETRRSPYALTGHRAQPSEPGLAKPSNAVLSQRSSIGPVPTVEAIKRASGAVRLQSLDRPFPFL